MKETNEAIVLRFIEAMGECDTQKAAACLAELRRLGYRAAVIGIVLAGSTERPRVFLEPGCVPAKAPVPAAAEG